MKLLRLTPEQIMHYWDSVKQCIWESLPPLVYEGEESFLRIQESLLVGEMQCWAALEDANSPCIYGIATTKIVLDECSGTKNLLIFSVTTIAAHPKNLWYVSYETLSKFAKSHQCKNMIAYSNNEDIIKIASQLKADTSWNLIQFPLAPTVLPLAPTVLPLEV